MSCFFCGASLEDAPPRRVVVPWADIVLFLVIGGLLAFWWFQSPFASSPQEIALANTRLAATAASPPTQEPAPTPLPPSPTPPPTATSAPTATPVPTPIRYKVEAGDSLELIAGRFGSTIKDIIEANNLGPVAPSG
jgi:nucleoid-associated protein YgaU